MGFRQATSLNCPQTSRRACQKSVAAAALVGREDCAGNHRVQAFMFACGESLRALVTLYPKPLIRNNTSSEPSKPSDHVRAKHKPNSPQTTALSASEAVSRNPNRQTGVGYEVLLRQCKSGSLRDTEIYHLSTGLRRSEVDS